MAQQNEIISKSTFFTLAKCKHRKNDSIHYRIKMHAWPIEWDSVADLAGYDHICNSFTERVRNIVDPKRNKAGRDGTQWKFRTLEEAEMYYSMLVFQFDQ